MQINVRRLAEQAAKNIDTAVLAAKMKIRSSITHSVLYVDIWNEKIKTEALPFVMFWTRDQRKKVSSLQFFCMYIITEPNTAAWVHCYVLRKDYLR